MTMKAISTKYIPATDLKGSRIKAYTEGNNSIAISYPLEYDGEIAHKIAAVALCRKMGWPQELIAGGTKEGYVFIMHKCQ
jgi:hypothetical protein